MKSWSGATPESSVSDGNLFKRVAFFRVVFPFKNCFYFFSFTRRFVSRSDGSTKVTQAARDSKKKKVKKFFKKKQKFQGKLKLSNEEKGPIT